MWYSWLSLQDFNIWHDIICYKMGIPRPGMNFETGEIDQDAQWTTTYTKVLEVGPNDWRAIVEDGAVDLDPDHLGVISESPPVPVL
jgi:hypothetical protein